MLSLKTLHILPLMKFKVMVHYILKRYYREQRLRISMHINMCANAKKDIQFKRYHLFHACNYNIVTCPYVYGV